LFQSRDVQQIEVSYAPNNRLFGQTKRHLPVAFSNPQATSAYFVNIKKSSLTVFRCSGYLNVPDYRNQLKIMSDQSSTTSSTTDVTSGMSVQKSPTG
jgi:hypothetical protein